MLTSTVYIETATKSFLVHDPFKEPLDLASVRRADTCSARLMSLLALAMGCWERRGLYFFKLSRDMFPLE